MDRSRIYVIVPAYNEAGIIRQTLQELLVEGWQLIVVDDASTDGTAAQIQDLPIHSLRHGINLGQGAALQTGMDYAKKLNAEAVIHFDADGQHQVSDLNGLLAPILAGEADVCLGSRFMTPDSAREVPIARKWLLKAAILVNACFTGMWLRDAHNGLRALNAEALDAIQLRENGMAHATEILSEIRRHQLRWQEVPVHIRYSAYSQAKGQSWYHAFGILGDLIVRKLLF